MEAILATDRTDETEDIFEDDEDIFSDDEELDTGSDNKSDNFDELKTQIRKEVEESVVEAIASGDTNSGVYKGLQKVLAKRDRELAEARSVLASVVDRLQGADLEGTRYEFLERTIHDLLDDEGQKEFMSRKERFATERKNKERDDLLDALLKGQVAPGGGGYYPEGMPRYGQQQEDPQITQYRKEATNKLKTFAKKALGISKDEDLLKIEGLEFGDEDEPLLARMDKLASSIERLSDERDEQEVSSVRRKGNLPNTRSNATPSGRVSVSGAALLERGIQKQLEQMRKL